MSSVSPAKRVELGKPSGQLRWEEAGGGAEELWEQPHRPPGDLRGATARRHLQFRSRHRRESMQPHQSAEGECHLHLIPDPPPYPFSAVPNTAAIVSQDTPDSVTRFCQVSHIRREKPTIEGPLSTAEAVTVTGQSGELV